MLTNVQTAHLIDLRHALHRAPELSGLEVETARRIEAECRALGADTIVTGLGRWREPNGAQMGGTGLAAVFDSGKTGPTLLFRCELDGLPIEEISSLPYRSEIPVRGHLCGHDGHMATLLGLGMRLGAKRPARGRVILLFQPAEETGKGARAVLADPAFAPLVPDYAFALHNLPGLPLGHVALKAGPACCASRGIIFHFEGKTSHASMPQDGLSPQEALCALSAGLRSLSNGLDAGQGLDEAYKLVTITHMTLGEPAFGVAPGSGALWATLRTVTDEAMAGLVEAAEALAHAEAERFGLKLEINEDDIFDACTNAPEATRQVTDALDSVGVPWSTLPDPMRFSEDFGAFSQHCPSSLFLLGSGVDQPQLHNPDFDFPDDLIGVGTRIFETIVRQALG